jgi:hypothetical protein
MSNGTAMTAMLAPLGLAGTLESSAAARCWPRLSRRRCARRPKASARWRWSSRPGAGAPAAGLIVAFGDFTALSISGAVGGILMFAAVRMGERESQEAAVAPS